MRRGPTPRSLRRCASFSLSESPGEQELVLPGNVAAFNTGSLFARASGYIAAWRKDIGARVTKGEILATISAPDLDQQLEQARGQLVQLQAAVQQAQANADLGRATDQRTSQLVVQGWQSKQQGDNDRLNAAAQSAGLAVAKANVTAQQSAVKRLEELTAFEEIRAPFDGVVTARNLDIGDLVNAGGNTGRALYQVADIHRMRIFVNVPQAFLGELAPGIKATLHLPGQKETFEAQLVSTSNALAETSRTALVELQADNPDGKLWPGAFAEVHFHIPADPNTLTVPLTALVFGAKGMQVAALDGDDKVVLKPVVVGRNFGNRVQIESGLLLADRLVDSPLEIHPDRRQGECRESGPEYGGARRQSGAEQTAEPLSDWRATLRVQLCRRGFAAGFLGRAAPVSPGH